MRRSKTGTVVLLLLWIAIAAILTGLLIHFISGGAGGYTIRPFYFNFSLTDSGQLIEHSSDQFDASAVDSIKVDCNVGKIEVTKSQDELIHVLVEISEKAEDRAANAELRDGVLTVSQSSGKVLVSSSYRHIVHIFLPEGWEKKFTGNLSTGDLEFSGEYRFSELIFTLSTGNFEGNSISADTLSVTGSTGSIRLDSLNSDNVLLRLSTGDITVGSFTGAGVLKTSTGRIDAELLSLTGDLDVSASTGDVDLTMIPPVSAKVRAETSVGKIRSDFPMLYGDNRVTGDVAECEIGKEPYPSLYVKTSTGGIRLREGS